MAASGVASLEMLGDPQLLELATRQRRVLVAVYVPDFAELARTRCRRGTDHGGVILVHSGPFRRTEIGPIVNALDGVLKSRSDFTNAVLYLVRPAS